MFTQITVNALYFPLPSLEITHLCVGGLFYSREWLTSLLCVNILLMWFYILLMQAFYRLILFTMWLIFYLHILMTGDFRDYMIQRLACRQLQLDYRLPQRKFICYPYEYLDRVMNPLQCIPRKFPSTGKNSEYIMTFKNCWRDLIGSTPPSAFPSQTLETCSSPSKETSLHLG